MAHEQLPLFQPGEFDGEVKYRFIPNNHPKPPPRQHVVQANTHFIDVDDEPTPETGPRPEFYRRIMD